MKKLLIVLALVLPISIGVAALADDGSGSGSAAVGSGSPIAPAPAPAPTPAVAPSITVDPSHPAQTVETAWSEVKQFGVIWGGMIVLFGIGTFIIKKNDETHWLSQDHYLPIGVGILGTIGAAINAKFAGGSWPAVLSTLMATVSLVLQKPTAGKNIDGTPKLPIAKVAKA